MLFLLLTYVGSLDVELTFNSPNTLSCVSNGGPVSAVIWRRNGDLIFSSSLYQQSQMLTNALTSTFLHTLNIAGGDAEDYNGTFSCTVSNSRGSVNQSLDIHGMYRQ